MICKASSQNDCLLVLSSLIPTAASLSSTLADLFVMYRYFISQQSEGFILYSGARAHSGNGEQLKLEITFVLVKKMSDYPSDDTSFPMCSMLRRNAVLCLDGLIMYPDTLIVHHAPTSCYVFIPMRMIQQSSTS